MMEHNHKHIAVKFIIAGLVIIGVRIYTSWDIWVVIGALLIIKALYLFTLPCHKSKK